VKGESTEPQDNFISDQEQEQVKVGDTERKLVDLENSVTEGSDQGNFTNLPTSRFEENQEINESFIIY
jgi:hypothetical protein